MTNLAGNPLTAAGEFAEPEATQFRIAGADGDILKPKIRQAR